ncbi:MAG: heat-inducible transcriptional repressor HrcA [Acidiferrobacterales bacterium]
MALTPRAEVLLKALIEKYISDGQPVGSRTLSKHAGLDLSPATIRNVMADLEDLGLICSPHTSAGRIPTPLGYRIFVDTLLKVRPVDSIEVRRMVDELAHDGDPMHLMESASTLLSQVTKLAGIVLVPRQEEEFRQIEFLSLSSANRVLVILVTRNGRVHNRVIHTDRRYSAAELVEAANYFNDAYSGRPLAAVRRILLQDLQRDGDAVQLAVRNATDMARQIFTNEDSSQPDLVVSGETNLLKIPDLGDIEKLRKLFDSFSTKRDLLHLLDQSMRAECVQIFIGGETGHQALEECSVVMAPYQIDGLIVGTLGVIGPTRMAYDQVISVVDVTARLLGGALSLEGR